MSPPDSSLLLLALRSAVLPASEGESARMADTRSVHWWPSAGTERARSTRDAACARGGLRPRSALLWEPRGRAWYGDCTGVACLCPTLPWGCEGGRVLLSGSISAVARDCKQQQQRGLGGRAPLRLRRVLGTDGQGRVGRRGFFLQGVLIEETKQASIRGRWVGMSSKGLLASDTPQERPSQAGLLTCGWLEKGRRRARRSPAWPWPRERGLRGQQGGLPSPLVPGRRQSFSQRRLLAARSCAGRTGLCRAV